MAIVNLKEELNLKKDLVFSEEHAVTNFATINYWNTNLINIVLDDMETE